MVFGPAIPSFFTKPCAEKISAPRPVIRVALQNHSSPIHHEDLQVMPTEMQKTCVLGFDFVSKNLAKSGGLRGPFFITAGDWYSNHQSFSN